MVVPPDSDRDEYDGGGSPDRRRDYSRRDLHDQVQQHEWQLTGHTDELKGVRRDARAARDNTDRVERMITDPTTGIAVKVATMETGFTKAINRLLVTVLVAGVAAIMSLLGTIFMLLAQSGKA